MSGIAAEYGTFLVTNGGFLPIPGGDIGQFAGYPTADFSVVDYLTLNHLAIVAHARPVVLDLCLNAQDFELCNINAVIDHLERHPIYLKVQMRIFLGGWLNESFLRIEEAVAHLRAIAERQYVPPQTRLRIAQLEPDSAPPATQGIIHLWQHNEGVFSGEFLGDALRRGVLDRTFVLEMEEGTSWVVRYMGAGISTFGEWHSEVVGRPVSVESSDPGYTSWVASHYDAVAQTREGRYDHIDAIVSTADRKPARIRYQRHLLPFVTLGGKPLVVGYSALSRDIALPL